MPAKKKRRRQGKKIGKSECRAEYSGRERRRRGSAVLLADKVLRIGRLYAADCFAGLRKFFLQACKRFAGKISPVRAVLCRAARSDVTGLYFVCCVVGRGSNNKACADKRMEKLYFSQMFFRRRKIV